MAQSFQFGKTIISRLIDLIYGILVLFLNNFKGTVFFYFESKSKFTRKVILMWNCSIINVIVSKKMQPVDSYKGYTNKGDSVIQCFVNFNH
jgi:hypothetical protein